MADHVLAHEPMTPELRAFIERYEWMGTVGVTPRWCFTARVDGVLAGVVCMNLPNAFAGDCARGQQCLIQRGASASFAHRHLGSRLIMWAVRWMVRNTEKRVFAGYSDPRAGERGVIYRACNFKLAGSDYGAKFEYRHPAWRSGQPFLAQSLRRTPVLKRWMRENGEPWLPAYAKSNGFKDLSALPDGVKARWYAWGRHLLRTATSTPLPPKLKWVLDMR
jgi:hypothetical protein